VTAVTVVSCSSRHASVDNWSTGEHRTHEVGIRVKVSVIGFDLSCRFGISRPCGTGCREQIQDVKIKYHVDVTNYD